MSRILLLVPTTSYRAAAFVSAAQTLDVEITLASEKTSSLEKFLPLDLMTLDFSDPHACAAKTMAFAREHPVHAVIGVDDQTTVAASAAGAALELPHNPLDAAYATRNKHTMRKRLDEAGVPVPGFRTLFVDLDPREAASDVEFPCVIKPLMMAASRGVIRADNTEEFVAAFDRVRSIVQLEDAPLDDESRTQVLVEDYVPGWEIAIEGMLTGGRLHVFAVFDKPDPLEGPYFPETIYTTPSLLPAEVWQRACRLTQEAIRVLGLRHGPVHAEIRGTSDEMWFIEVAARSIGGYCSKVLRFDGGLSLEDIILRHALDPKVALPERDEGAAGVMMLQSPRKGVFVEARGVEAARDVKHVDEIIVSAYPGQELSPLPEGFLYVGFIFARAGTPAAVEHALRQAYGELEFVIE
ncbi:MAG: ATP-grasp domain-containing protein [Candidatus Krumholzibacteria bacterium]